MEILDLLREIEELIEDASTVPFSNKVMIDRDDINEMLKKINVAIPEEVRRAKWIKEEKDQILIEARKEAESIIKAAQEEEARLINHAKFEENKVIEDARNIADRLISESEITTLTENHCRNLVKDAEEKAIEIKDGAYRYADEILEELQYKLSEFGETINHNRNELHKYCQNETE